MNKVSAPFKLPLKINPPVFYSSTVLIFLIVLFAVAMPEQSNKFFSDMQGTIVTNVSWFYVAAVALILLTVAYLGISRMGDIKLGPDHSEPDFSHGSWFAMLFSAGMGIGLMFFGVAEPVMHYLSPPTGDPGSVEAAREAMKLTFFHWGLHAWGIYAMVALILAYFGYRHGLPLTLRSALYPLIGDKIYGPIGHAVDVFAILGTVFGVATSLGYGVLQVNSGLHYLFDVPVNQTVQVILIVVISGLAAISVATGLDKGIRILSEINLFLAIALVGMVLLLGPTVLLLQMYLQNTGGYLSDIVNKTFNLFAYEPTDWLGGWTLLYWGWWLSWSPFVGMFIARISRGRTIREFVIGVLFVPTGFTFLWMTVFGNTSIDMIMAGTGDGLAQIVDNDVSLALFKFLEHFPFSSFLSLIAIIMVVVFFVTSSDSGSMVVDMLASGGTDKTPVWQRVYWASLEGVVAIALLLAGGLGALQTATIASALPFCIVLMVAAYGLLKALNIDAAKRYSLEQVIHPPRLDVSKQGWERRLKNLVHFPRRKNVSQFIAEVVMPGMQSVSEELIKHGVDARYSVEKNDINARFEVYLGDEQDFIYRVRPKAYLQPSFSLQEEDDDERQYYRAEVFLTEGGQDYDIMGWSKEQVISDIVDQYEKHLHFLHQVR
ncbi:BCCT family transporter [Motilimonas pumila]|uniref:BCCT family transporter n=1 Tax=Motilimonas pumila TaxID=2303987 RepID=A0A418YBE3_9GAMM|nr:choline BCCT transporter BetT [Motilimonas pumila]RJG40304.1 BCCT family transporter [Motilimonas pumila]